MRYLADPVERATDGLSAALALQVLARFEAVLLDWSNGLRVQPRVRRRTYFTSGGLGNLISYLLI